MEIVILAPNGTPAQKTIAIDTRCPRCGSGPDKRVPSGGFGAPHPVCGQCGHEWHGEVFHRG